MAYDIVIVGSGYGGSIPALRLAQAGMKVLVLERGERKNTEDFQHSDSTSYIQSIIDYVIGSSNIGFRTGKLLGGASIPMDGGFFRNPTRSFAATDAQGRRYWPAALSRAELDPYYATVESMLHVRQMTWAEIPKAGGMVGKMLAAADASCELAMMNYGECVQCGFCTQGCKFGKKHSLPLTYIPAAEALGAEFRTGAMVQDISKNGATYSLRVVSQGKTETITAPRVIVAGGGIHTPALLLRSKNTLGTLSEHVGQHLNTNGEHTFIGLLPSDFDGVDDYTCYKGMDNAGLMSFEYYEEDGFSIHPGGGFEPSILGANLNADNHPVLPQRSWGLAYKRFAEQMYPRRIVSMAVLGLAESHLRVTLNSDGSPDVILTARDAHDAYLDKVDARMTAMAAKSGVTLATIVRRAYSGMTSAHLLASCRMAERVEDGVVDADGQVFNNENLYVCDAAAVPFALGVNPALTISAIAERTAAQIIRKG